MTRSLGGGGGVDAVDKVSLMSNSVHGATISHCVVPSRGRDNVAAGGMSCSAAATVPGGDASGWCELVKVGKVAAAYGDLRFRCDGCLLTVM